MAHSIDVDEVRPGIPSQVVHTGVAASGQSGSLGDVVQKDGDGNWQLADASTPAGVTGMIGIVVAGHKATPAGTWAASEKLDVVVHGRVFGISSLDETKTYYVSDTAGDMAESAGTITRALGYAETGDIFFVTPDTSPSS